jgi:hypothetical protein
MGESCQPSAHEQEKLEQWIAAHGTPQQVVLCISHTASSRAFSIGTVYKVSI